ncbi:hypothetical protein [Corynebacterium flavescens]|uniref:hypothetical protein n=1 Tax=Corynebacterium flavescens TaxID=28028 RepID=UPI003FD1D12F
MSSQPSAYTPADSIAYLHHTVYRDLQAAVNELDLLAEDSPAIAEDLKELALYLDDAAEKIDQEAITHRLIGATHYSTGVPIEVNYETPEITQEDGTTRRGKRHLVNHPTIDEMVYLEALKGAVVIPIRAEDIRRIGDQ